MLGNKLRWEENASPKNKTRCPPLSREFTQSNSVAILLIILLAALAQSKLYASKTKATCMGGCCQPHRVVGKHKPQLPLMWNRPYSSSASPSLRSARRSLSPQLAKPTPLRYEVILLFWSLFSKVYCPVPQAFPGPADRHSASKARAAFLLQHSRRYF